MKHPNKNHMQYKGKDAYWWNGNHEDAFITSGHTWDNYEECFVDAMCAKLRGITVVCINLGGKAIRDFTKKEEKVDE